MASLSHSELLLSKVREGMKRRGWNRAALAQAMGTDRRRLRGILGGRDPLTVEDFFTMVEALQLSAEELGLPEGALPVPGDETGEDALPEDSEPAADQDREPPALQLAAAAEADDHGVTLVDPEGPQVAEILRLGFALGVDMHFVCSTDELRHSGVPESVRARFPDLLPVKLDAAYHHAHRVRYLPEGLQLRLSFDSVYSCLFPWSAIRQVTLVPEAPLDPEPEPEPELTSGPPRLRLVDP